MPRPRNYVVRAMLTRRGGAHQQSRSGERQQEQALVEAELEEWRQEQDLDANSSDEK